MQINVQVRNKENKTEKKKNAQFCETYMFLHLVMNILFTRMNMSFLCCFFIIIIILPLQKLTCVNVN